MHDRRQGARLGYLQMRDNQAQREGSKMLRHPVQKKLPFSLQISLLGNTKPSKIEPSRHSHEKLRSSLKSIYFVMYMSLLCLTLKNFPHSTQKPYLLS